MLPYNSWVSRAAFGAFFVILIGYGYFEARGLLYGPQIQIPDVIAPVHEQFIHIRGSALHIASLSLNGRQIAVTETGEFDEPYLLAPGTNRLVLEARDKYGNTTDHSIQIVYIPLESSSVPTPATSTPALTATSTSSSTPTQTQ